MVKLNKLKYLDARNAFDKITADEIYNYVNDILNADIYCN